MQKGSFEATVEKFKLKFLEEIERIVKETAELIAERAEKNVPVDTGDLRNSISIKYEKHGLRAIITVGEYYGIFVEYGTGIYSRDNDGRKMPWVYYKNGQYYWTQGNRPQPFFFPAVADGFQYFQKELNRLGA